MCSNTVADVEKGIGMGIVSVEKNREVKTVKAENRSPWNLNQN